jgi:tape measure domain-containing protein
MLGSKLQGQATKDIFDGVQVAASAMGLSSEDAKGTFLALGQMMGKGKVQAEELRGQLGERIPGAMNIAARAMGVTTAELDKMMEQGQLISEDFLPKFSKELKKTFGKALPTAVQSSQAQFNRFNNSMLELKLTLGNKLMPVVNGVMSGFKKVMDFLKRNKAVILDALQPLIDLGSEIMGMYRKLGEQLGITGSASEFFAKALGFVKRALQFLKPVFSGLLKITFSFYTSIIKIGKAFGGLLDRFPVIGRTFTGLVSMIREGFLIIKDAAVNILGGVGDLLAGIFSGNLDQIKEGLKGIGKGADGVLLHNSGKRMGDAFMSGFNAETGLGVVTLKGAGSKGGATLDDVLGGGGDGNKTKLLGGDQTNKNKKSTSLTGVKGGRPTHINIDIGKLIENFNITTTNMQDTTNQLKDKIAQTLLGAVNNVNNIAQ